MWWQKKPSRVRHDSDALLGSGEIVPDADGVPDATARRPFRHLLKTHDLPKAPSSELTLIKTRAAGCYASAPRRQRTFVDGAEDAQRKSAHLSQSTNTLKTARQAGPTTHEPLTRIQVAQVRSTRRTTDCGR